MADGTKLGLSIGARIPEGGAVRNKKTGALLISHVELMETSVVGLPANPRSWIDAATKALRAAPVAKLSAGTGVVMDGIEAPADGTVVELDTTETIVSVDITDAAADPSASTDAPSQDLETSAPETDGAVATPDVVAAANDVLDRTADPEVDQDQAKALLIEAHNILAKTTNRLIETEAALEVETQRADRAEV
jgi:hypothetical protein